MNREQTVEKLKTKLDQWNADLDDMEARARKAREEGRAEAEQTIEDLKRKREKARGQLEQLKSASDNAFSDMLKGIENGWKEVTQSFEQAKKRYH